MVGLFIWMHELFISKQDDVLFKERRRTITFCFYGKKWSDSCNYQKIAICKTHNLPFSLSKPTLKAEAEQETC